MAEEILFEAEHVKKWFPVKGSLLGRSRESVKAVDDVSLQVRRGETLGIVGESGCGKSTLIRVMMRLLNPTAGRLFFEGEDITHVSGEKMQSLRRSMQIVFQDPYASLDPRQRVGDMLGEPLAVHHLVSGRAEAEAEKKKLLRMVGLPEDALSKFPHEFSGGQRQRLCIARALAVRPKLLMCDECVSALDVSIQAQIVNLLMKLQREMDLTIVFVSHDLRVVRHMAAHVAVMYLGKVVEYADNDSLFRHPAHPYTESLLSAVPSADPDAVKKPIVLKGDIPSPIHVPEGCSFHTRCWMARKECSSITCSLEPCGEGHCSACPFRRVQKDRAV